MKTLIKLIIAVIVLNATARLGMSALTQYQFRDAAQEAVLFGSHETTGELQAAILEEAEDLGVALEGEDVNVERQGMLTTAEVTYTDNIEVFPRYTYPMVWSFKVDARRIVGQ